MSVTTAPETAAKVRVLIADDAVDVRRLMRLTLEKQGFEVVAEATNGAEAVALAQAYLPDVLLLDVAMPVMDGLEALRELQRLSPDLPVVMHSGFSESSLGESCLRAGAVAYTEKGIDPLPLARVLREAAAGLSPGPPASPRHPVPLPASRTVGVPKRARRDPRLALIPDRAVVLVAAVLFVAIFALRLSMGQQNDAAALSVLYVVPVALLAARLGVRGGLVGTAIAGALLGAYVVTGQTEIGVVGVGTRMVAFLVIGLAVGTSADRVQRLLAYEKRAAAAIVSANQQLAEALEQSRSSIMALEAANEDLRQFGYIVSHDLAEPLRSMSGFSSLLESDYAERLDERGLEYLGFIRDGAVRMRALIDDLRAYTDAGQQDVVLQPVDLDQVLSDVIRGLSATLTERAAVVEADGLPVVLGDRSLLALVLQNLVSNGIKFTNSDQPRVRLTVAPVEDGLVAVDITDNGIGIPQEHADRVFGLFSRLHTREQYPGTGLGLAITKRIVERHGGRIRIVPSTTGTTFRLSLASGADLRAEDTP